MLESFVERGRIDLWVCESRFGEDEEERSPESKFRRSRRIYDYMPLWDMVYRVIHSVKLETLRQSLHNGLQ
jgi:hypothetical protein